MKIEYLKLLNYRNYEKLEISFSDTLNLIYGNNGSGKSNLIEAIYLLALSKSFRTNIDTNLIKKNAVSTTVTGKIRTNTTTKYELTISENGKKVFINNDKINKISDYVSKINIILFNPLDTKIINESPSVRRKLINIDISQLNNDYLLLLNDYNRILKHRNAYLKQLLLNGNASSEYIDILTNKLIELGLKINNMRSNFIQDINNNISKIYKNIFETGELKIKYISSFNNKTHEDLLKQYKKVYKKEMSFGKTAFGIHHDDIDFILDGESIKEYGSVGQQKNAIISFKLSELLLVKQVKGYYPILILDDLFSELDDNKVNNILGMLNKEVQTFITTTSIDKVNEELLKDSTIFKVEDGNIERRNM